MSVRRFFIDPAQITGDEAVLTGAEAHHLTRVLRLPTGAAVSLLDGTGRVYEATVASISRDKARLRVLRVREEPAPASHLTLGVALLKGSKMELVIQKATELGVHAILPFHSRYCDLKPSAETRRERWLRVALEACKQCGRATPPVIGATREFAAFVQEEAGHEFKCILWEQAGENVRLRDLFAPGRPPGSALVLVGPEGGFLPEEAALAEHLGYRPLSLGTRILRAETAAIAAAAIFQYELDNLTL